MSRLLKDCQALSSTHMLNYEESVMILSPQDKINMVIDVLQTRIKDVNEESDSDVLNQLKMLLNTAEQCLSTDYSANSRIPVDITSLCMIMVDNVIHNV